MHGSYQLKPAGSFHYNPISVFNNTTVIPSALFKLMQKLQ